MEKNKELNESERKILQTLLLAPDYKLRWNELLEKTKLSKRTLSKSLQRLQECGYVHRFLDPKSTEYPPPVYYQLAEERKDVIAPLLFSIYSFYYAMGLLENIMKAPTLTPISSLTEPLKIMARRLFARSFFAFIKYLETGNPNWYAYVKDDLSINPLMLFQIGFALLPNVDIKAKADEKEMNGLSIIELKYTEISIPQKNAKKYIEGLKWIVKKAFPKEFDELEKIFQASIKFDLQENSQKVSKDS